MKLTSKLLIVTTALICGGDFFAAEIPLEYVTADALQVTLRNEAVKTDVFYWGNYPRDRMLIPVTNVEPGGTTLEIRGGEGERADRNSLTSFLTRLLPVTAGKTKATVTIETNYSFNLWSAARHSTNAANDFPTVSVFFGDGKRVCADIPFPTVAIPTSWNENTKTFDIPPSAKFIGLTITAPGGAVSKVRNINVIFE